MRKERDEKNHLTQHEGAETSKRPLVEEEDYLSCKSKSSFSTVPLPMLRAVYNFVTPTRLPDTRPSEVDLTNQPKEVGTHITPVEEAGQRQPAQVNM